jgi:hypothetical protein
MRRLVRRPRRPFTRVWLYAIWSIRTIEAKRPRSALGEDACYQDGHPFVIGSSRRNAPPSPHYLCAAVSNTLA